MHGWEGRPFAPFTRREREALALLAGGFSNRQIADALAISERTAESHVANVLGKLGLANRVQVIAWAVGRRDIGEPAPALSR
jgi:DNA-binding NarL/FixJ family response regulator